MYRRSKKYPELFHPGAGKVWWAFIPNPAGGKRLRESTGHLDEKAAHLWYLDRIRRPRDEKPQILLTDALDRRKSERAAIGRASATLQFLDDKKKQLVRLLGANLPLEQLTARVIDAYVVQRRQERRTEKHEYTSRATIYKELVVLRGAMRLARRQGYACPAPDEIMPLDLSGQSKPKERVLTPEEIEKLLAKLPPHRAAIAAFLLATGATYPSEVKNLRKSDVDVEGWKVRLRGTKRETRDRVVPIVVYTRAWLRQAMLYFPFQPWVSVRRDLHKACDDAGIERCSPNDLRRTFGTMLRNHGVEPQLIGAAMGHRDSRMVERVYGRLTPDALSNLLELRIGDQKKARRKKQVA